MLEVQEGFGDVSRGHRRVNCGIDNVRNRRESAGYKVHFSRAFFGRESRVDPSGDTAVVGNGRSEFCDDEAEGDCKQERNS